MIIIALIFSLLILHCSSSLATDAPPEEPSLITDWIEPAEDPMASELLTAIRNNDIKIITRLLSINPLLTNYYGLDIADKAFHVNDPMFLKILLDAGFNPNEPDYSGIPLLLKAIKLNKYEIAKALLESGANANITYDTRYDDPDYDNYGDDDAADSDNESDDSEDLGPLSRDNYKLYASREMDRKARAERPGREANYIISPLLAAAENKNIRILELLIAFDADPMQVNAFQYTYLEWAKKPEIAAFIQDVRHPARLPLRREECKRWHIGMRSSWIRAVVCASKG